MSTEVTLYPPKATKDQLKKHLLTLSYTSCGHLWNWPSGSIHFWWFERKDFKSFDGVEATIYQPWSEEQEKYGKCTWALHTRTRAGASVFDKEHQNHTIRTARKLFGGTFYNDWHGVNRYTPLWEEERGAAGRGIYLSYETVIHNITAVQFSLPQPSMPLAEDNKVAEALSRYDPVRVLYNALVPFAVSALEHFFGQTFRILLQYDPNAHERLKEITRKIEVKDVMAISKGETTIEEIIANWYSFQNIQSIHTAFKEWFEIDIWKLLRRRRRIGRRVAFLEKQLTDLIQFRHGVIHRLELDLDLTREQLSDLLTTARVVIDSLVDHLEQDHHILIRE